MRHHLSIACGLLLLYGLAPVESRGQDPIFEVGKSQISNVEFYTTNYGIFGLNPLDPYATFTVPRGSKQDYMFGSGLWVGARKPVSTDGGITFEEKKLSFITYNPNSGKSWAYPGTYHQTGTPTIAQPILYNSVNFDRTTGEELVPRTWAKWPLWMKSGEKTSPLFPGNVFLYGLPASNDRPAFMDGVDEQFFSYYHDKNLAVYEIGASQAQAFGYPIGLQITQNIYAWKRWDVRQNVVVIQYEVENMSNETLRDCYLAQVADPDIGSAINDRVSYYDANPLIHAGIAWSEQESADYGTLAMIMLEAPVVDAEGFVDESRRALFRSSDDVHTFINWIVDIDPGNHEERYDFMAEERRDRDNGPGDKRILMGSKPFNMRPGDKAHFAIAFAVLEGITPDGTLEVKGDKVQAGEIPALEELAATLHKEYYETSFLTSSVNHLEEVESGLRIWPNPAGDETTVRIDLSERSDVSLHIVDNLGRTVRTFVHSNEEPGERTFHLDLDNLESGSYLLSIDAGNEHRTARLNLVR